MNASEKKKYQFASALNTLMKTQPLDKISVTQIVEEADVTRPTFYRHFKDKYDLVNWYFDKLAQRSFRQMGISMSFREGLITKFRLMQEEKIFFRSAFLSENQNCLIDYDYECIYQFYSEVIKQKGIPMEEDMDFLLRMYCRGSIYMTAEWARNGMKISPEQMADRLSAAVPPKLFELFKNL